MENQKKKNGLPVSIFEQVMLLLMGAYFPFLFMVHSGFSEEVKAVLFFLLLSAVIAIIAKIFYKKNRKRFALELTLFYGGFNLFLVLPAYYACLVRLIFFPEISLITKPLEVVLVYCSPVIGFIFACYSIKKLMDINQVYDGI